MIIGNLSAFIKIQTKYLHTVIFKTQTTKSVKNVNI